MTENIVRSSQLISTWGPGAMLDLPDCSVIVSGLGEWSRLRRERIDEPRLAAKLAALLDRPAVELWTPPAHEENAARPAPVGARIFPTWFIVRDAVPAPGFPLWRRRRLVQWRDLDRRRFPDPDDGGKLKPVVPVRFVAACRRGHIDDLDWRSFVHKGGDPCRRPLWIEERGPSGDVADAFGVCDCGAERSIYEAWGRDNPALGNCRGRRPWIGQFAREACGEPYRLLVRTASNAWFPQIMSVISLPESDSGLAREVGRQYDRLKAADDLGVLAHFRKVPELAAAFAGAEDDAVVAEYRRRRAGAGQDLEVPVKTAEFAILDSGAAIIGEDDPSSRFHAETLPRADWDPNGDSAAAMVDKLALAHRIREVRALLGFTRFEAVSPDKEGEIDLDVERAALAETVDWLPAVENRGEGVFLSLRRDAVEAWLRRPAVAARADRLRAGWRQWAKARGRPPDGFPGAAYVMLHSLSHMLMTRIALDSGYPASALRERVYAGEAGHGVLIYTGSPDSDGTLGGLVEAGRRLARHLRRALEDNRLCSNDPVCAEHAPDSAYEDRLLHGAACHGCLLIAETSCEQRNDFLDRALVVPTVGAADAAFFPASVLDP